MRYEITRPGTSMHRQVFVYTVIDSRGTLPRIVLGEYRVELQRTPRSKWRLIKVWRRNSARVADELRQGVEYVDKNFHVPEDVPVAARDLFLNDMHKVQVEGYNDHIQHA